MSGLDYQRDAQQVPLDGLSPHLVSQCPKRRRNVLVHQIGKRCDDLMRQQCDEKGWTSLDLAVQPDHVQLFVRVWPAVSATEVVKACKGFSACTLRKEFPDLHRVPSLWTRSYFASTAGHV